MSEIPSTTTYYPFDSDAPPVFNTSQIDNILTAASIALLLYDHVITLDKEVEWIWTLKWRLPKMLFIMNRYVITALLMLTCIPEFLYPVFVPFCKSHLAMWLAIPLLNFGAAELLLIIRVCSLYEHRKLIVWSLSIFFALAFIGAIVAQVLFGSALTTILYYEFLPGCWEYSAGTPNQWVKWVTFLLVEGIIMFLTAYKAITYHNHSNRTITILARDSIIYFVIVFACLASVLASDLRVGITISVQIPAQCVASIAVGRMMMNMRGLILKDPVHTLHLQSLQFVATSDTAEGTAKEAV